MFSTCMYLQAVCIHAAPFLCEVHNNTVFVYTHIKKVHVWIYYYLCIYIYV